MQYDEGAIIVFPRIHMLGIQQKYAALLAIDSGDNHCLQKCSPSPARLPLVVHACIRYNVAIVICFIKIMRRYSPCPPKLRSVEVSRFPLRQNHLLLLSILRGEYGITVRSTFWPQYLLAEYNFGLVVVVCFIQARLSPLPRKY